MTIQINTDKNLNVHEDFNSSLQDVINRELKRFDELITRIEVHLSDENGNKEASNDKRCMIEARMKGREPVAVSATADNYNQAVTGALHKLKASLDSIVGKLRTH